MAEQERSTGKGNKLVDLDAPDPKKKTATGQVPVQKSPTGEIPAQKTSTGQIPAQKNSGSHAAITHSGVSQSNAAPLPPGTSGPREQTKFQKSQLASAFQAQALEQKQKFA